jgi:hypothetical protein
MDFKTRPRSYYTDDMPARHKEESEKTSEQKANERPHKIKSEKRSRTRHWKKVLLTLIILGIFGWLAYGYMTTKNQLQTISKGKPEATVSQQLIDKVGLLVDLPQNEAPTIATVNNASKLKNQEFFARAADGDKVMIFNKSGLAVLYRPSTNRVIEYSKVNLANSTQSQ